METDAEIVEQRYQAVAGLLDAQLIVVGDSHSHLFSGYDFNPNGMRFAPHIRTQPVGPALAWTLMSENSTVDGRNKTLATFRGARDFGYTGWLMLSFGAIDLNCHIMERAVKSAMIVAVRDLVTRYVTFIDEVRKIYPKVAVWGPPPALSEGAMELYENYYGQNTVLGSEIDRNYAILLFNNFLNQALTPRGVPFLSVAETFMHENGRTNHAFFIDNNHFNVRTMPFILDLVEERLSLSFERPAEYKNLAPVELARITHLFHTAPLQSDYIRFTFPSHRFVTDIAFEAPRACHLDVLEVSTAREHSPGSASLTFSNVKIPAGAQVILNFNQWARRLSFKLITDDCTIDTIKIIGLAGQFSRTADEMGNSLSAMRNSARVLSQAYQVPIQSDGGVPGLSLPRFPGHRFAFGEPSSLRSVHGKENSQLR
jgi:hypothetical protein